MMPRHPTGNDSAHTASGFLPAVIFCLFMRPIEMLFVSCNFIKKISFSTLPNPNQNKYGIRTLHIISCHETRIDNCVKKIQKSK